MLVCVSLLLSARGAKQAPREPNPPEWPSTVHVFGPKDADRIDSIVQALYADQDLYKDQRAALLFKPGRRKQILKLK
jgi:hypothetical protein